ncbi:ATP-binding protein [Methanotorris igneus]|nr:ATP-binding protein [Methanotorris igneus]
MKFFNREKEIKEISVIIEGEPNLIYFIYGPINSGKTTLINHIINNELKKSNKKYAVFYVNFREYDISSMNNFVEALFEVDESSKSNKMREYIEYFTKGLNDIINISYGIKISEPLLDRLFGEKEKGRLVFKFIRDLFISLNNKGIQPVFILDELQMIKDIVMNGERPLLKSLFQFLVSLTKERHLAHCLCLTSDSLFIEYVYNTGELKDRSDYILVDDFDKEMALRFMDFLAEELLNKPLSEEQKELIYSTVGGKPILIHKVIDKMRYKELNTILDEMIKIEVSKLKKLLIRIKNNKFKGIDYNKVVNALSLFKKEYLIDEYTIDEDTKEFLIKENILFLNPQEGTLKPQSFLVWNAIKKVVYSQ